MSQPSRRSDGRRNRQRILRSARQRLLDGGDFTMTALSRDTGLTRATVYRHFADRAAVLDGLAAEVAESFVEQILASVQPLPLDDALSRLAHDAMDVVERHGFLLDAHDRGLDDLARVVVPDEPIASFFAQRRAAGELVSPLHDLWLARAVRALCLSAMLDGRPAADRADDLAWTLCRLVDGDVDPRIGRGWIVDDGVDPADR